jgi:hypothetical protein
LSEENCDSEPRNRHRIEFSPACTGTDVVLSSTSPAFRDSMIDFLDRRTVASGARAGAGMDQREKR